MSKLRPGCVSAMPQSMRNRSKRQTHSDRPSEDGAQGALRSRCPTARAINSNRQTGVQRRKRSTSIAELVSNGRRAYHSNRRTGPRTKDRGQLRRFGPRCLRRTNVKLRFGSIPSWATGGERIILRSCPCNRDHAPRFLWSETLEKAKQCSHYHRPTTLMRGPAGPLPQTAAKVFTKVDGDSPHREPATSAKATG